jgi:hypothetical protein
MRDVADDYFASIMLPPYYVQEIYFKLSYLYVFFYLQQYT